MVKNSSGGGLANVAAAGIGGIYVVRMIQQVRHRATNPDVDDPGRRYLRWLPAALALLGICLVALAILLSMAVDTVLAVVAAIALAFLALIFAPVITIAMWVVAERRRRECNFVICEADYSGAPRQIKSAMRRIYRSARSLREGAAYREEMFGELGLDRLVYTTAMRAVIASGLAIAARDLRPDAVTTDGALLEQANTQIQVIKDELAEVEQTIKRASKIADSLSHKITEPERERAAEQARTAAAVASEDRRERARTKLEDATSRASLEIDHGHNDFEERVTAVAAGYDEATTASTAGRSSTINTQTTKDDSHAHDEPSGSSVGDAAVRSARFAAGKAARLSGEAAKAGMRRLRDRD